MTARPRTTHLARIEARVSLPAHRAARGLLDGRYAAVQAGRSTDFHDLREYVRGDDVKDLDHKASARSRTPLVRRYVAVRNHHVLLVVSTGRSMAANSDATTRKRDVAVLCAGLVGWLACRSGDPVGLVHGDAERQVALPFGTGRPHLERLLAAAYDATTPAAAGSDVAAVLDHVSRTVRRRTLMLVVGDDDATPELARALRRATVQHEVLQVGVTDLDPTSVAPSAQATTALDTGRMVPAWVREDPVLRAELAAETARREQALRALADGAGVSRVAVADEATAPEAVLGLLERHRRAGRR